MNVQISNLCQRPISLNGKEEVFFRKMSCDLRFVGGGLRRFLLIFLQPIFIIGSPKSEFFFVYFQRYMLCFHYNGKISRPASVATIRIDFPK